MSEYNPLNERFKKQYEEALIHGAYRAKQTVNAAWKAINLFEEFTGRMDFTTFNTEQAKGFKRWLETQQNKKGEPLSLSTVCSTLANVREFFKWLAMHPKCIRKVDARAAMYLRLSNNDERASRATRDAPVPTIDEIRRTLEKMPYETDVQKRDRAIIAFTALTAVRDDALVTMKIKNVDIEKREIWQNPRNVRTKNRKSITTFFMAFDPLWEEIFVEWYKHATQTLSFKDNDALFPKQLVKNNPEKLAFEAAGLSREHWANAQPVRDIFKKSFTNAILPYYIPHSFRKTLVLWAMENCTQKQFKAISQNIGHENAMTTYNAYGKLPIHDQRKAVFSIDENNSDLKDVTNADLIAELGRRTQK